MKTLALNGFKWHFNDPATLLRREELPSSCRLGYWVGLTASPAVA